MLIKITQTATLFAFLASGAIAAGSGGYDSDVVTTTLAPSKLSQAVKLIKVKKYKSAIPLLNAAIAKNAQNADAWNYLGFSNRKIGKYDAAFVAYAKALAINPKHRGAYEYLGELYLQTGHPDRAKVQLANLGKICIFGCEEMTDLKNAIAKYEQANSS